MIADLDETIRQLLIAELPIKNGEIDISFHQPKREWSARLSRPTVNFFLYDLRENVTLRQHQWERIPGGNGDNQVKMKRTPFRVDCLYMLTTWASEPEDEHRLLTRTLMALFRFPIFPDDRLVGSLKKPPFEIQSHLAVHDKLTNPAEVWSSLDNEMRPSIAFIVTLALDPWKEVTGPAVRIFSMRVGQARTLPQYQTFSSGAVDVDLIFVGGQICKQKIPQKDIQVAIKGTGLFDTTNEQGQFTLGALLPGEYTLVAWPPDGKPKEKKISLPIKPGEAGDKAHRYEDYDIDLG